MKPAIYLNFNGNCLEAMECYAQLLGGEISGVFRNADAPANDRMPGGDHLVMNMAMMVDGVMFMASDAPEAHYQEPQGFSVSLQIDSADEADRIYSELSRDARSVMMEMQETFWAEKFAMFTDRFGTPWMINFTGSKAMGG